MFSMVLKKITVANIEAKEVGERRERMRLDHRCKLLL